MTPGEPIDVQLEVDGGGRRNGVAIGDDWTASADFGVTFSHSGRGGDVSDGAAAGGGDQRPEQPGSATG